MRKENILIIVLVCLGIAGFLVYNNFNQARFTGTVSTDGSSNSDTGYLIEWKAFDQGMKLAKEQNKPVFLYFYADWCTFCKKLKKTTFRDEKVLSYLKDHFISIKVNTDIEREMASKWAVTGLPTSFFLDSDANKINAIPGYFDEKKFLSILKYHFTKSYEDMSYPQFLKKAQ